MKAVYALPRRRRQAARFSLAVLVVGLELAVGPGRALAQRALGIDVYSGSGYITWSSVKSSGVTWAWAKASEGYGYTDSQIANNMNNARAAGVLIGPYHFARYDLGNSAANEANWFWSVISPYIKADGTEIMPMLDVEVTNTLSYSQAQISQWVVTWCQTLISDAAAAGITLHPVIYTYPWYADTYLNTSVSQNYALDMADLNGENVQTGSPYLSTWSTWVAWQYSWTGVVPGVPGTSSGGYCDEDVFNGTLDDLKKTLVIGCVPTVINSQPVSITNCQGTTATFSANVTGTFLSYQWQKNGANISGATASTLSLSGVTTNNSGTYTVQISNSCGNVTPSASATLTVSVAPTITNQPANQSVCQGGSASFSVTATGVPLAYQWQFNGTNLSGGTLSSYSLGNVHTNKAGNYTVIVSNSCGVVTSAVATLTVPVPPAFTTQPQSQTVCQGASVSLCVTATGTPLTYQWQFNGNNLSGGTLSCYTLGNVHTNKAGDYTVIVSNACGAVTSAVATLTVLVPPAITVPPQSQVVTQGGSAALTLTATGAYQWQFNGNNVNGGTLSSYSLGNVQAGQAGAYTVVLTNACGSLTSAVAWLTVVMPLANQTALQGGSATFTVTNAGADPSLTCQWQKNGANLTDGGHVAGSITTNLSLSNVSTNDTGSYAVVVANGVGSNATVGATLTVVVPQPPRFDSIGLLPDGSVELSMSGTPGLSYDLECTSNWVDWVVLTNFTNSDCYTDPAPAAAGSRFYRLRLCP